MKQEYRGFDIHSTREISLGGWNEVYWGAYRVSDGYELACGFGGGSMRDMFSTMKIVVDRFIDEYGNDENKWEEFER